MTPATNEPPLPAPIGKRVLAAILDIAFLLVVFVLYTMVFGETESTNEDGTTGFNLKLEGAATVGFAVLGFLYYFGLEAMFGQTLGKKLLGLRVVALDNGYLPPKAALRTICRLVDVLPALYFLGFIVMLATKRKQRIGDLAAGTIVTRA